MFETPYYEDQSSQTIQHTEFIIVLGAQNLQRQQGQMSWDIQMTKFPLCLQGARLPMGLTLET